MASQYKDNRLIFLFFFKISLAWIFERLSKQSVIYLAFLIVGIFVFRFETNP